MQRSRVLVRGVPCEVRTEWLICANKQANMCRKIATILVEIEKAQRVEGFCRSCGKLARSVQQGAPCAARATTASARAHVKCAVAVCNYARLALAPRTFGGWQLCSTHTAAALPPPNLINCSMHGQAAPACGRTLCAVVDGVLPSAVEGHRDSAEVRPGPDGRCRAPLRAGQLGPPTCAMTTPVMYNPGYPIAK